MSIWELFTLVGAISTLTLGSLTIYMSLRKKRYPGEVTIISQKGINLVDEIVSKIDKIKITYGGAEIAHNVIFLRGYIINTGSIDIAQEMVREEISATVPEGFRLLEAEVSPSNPKLKVDWNILSEKTLRISVDLLRRNETLSFQVVMEAPSRNSKNENEDKKLGLHWDHRIKDVGSVKVESLSQTVMPVQSGLRALSISIVAMVVIIGVLGLIVIPYLSKYELRYEVLTETEEKKIVQIQPFFNGQVNVIQINGNYKERITIDEFYQKFTPKILIQEIPFTERRDFLTNLILFIIVTLMSSTFFLFQFMLRNKDRKLSQFLN